MREFVAFEDVEVVKRSDRALLCRVERKEVWVPQSHIALTDDAMIRRAGDCGRLVIPRRLAVDLGWSTSPPETAQRPPPAASAHCSWATRSGVSSMSRAVPNTWKSGRCSTAPTGCTANHRA